MQLKQTIFRAVVVCGIVAVGYAAYRHRTVNNATQIAATPGWEDLSGCSSVVSLDGTKALDLNENKTAVLRRDENKDVDGQWSFDEASKRYAVTLDGVTSAYAVVSLPTSCMLVAGDVGAADLRASWFSGPDDADSGPERERDSP